MRLEQKEQLIYRIVNGEQNIDIEGERIVLKTPSVDIKLQAAKIYDETISQNRFNIHWLTEKQCLGLLVSNGICSFDIDKNLKVMEKEIENIKVALFNSLFIPDVHEDSKKRLKMVKSKLMSLSKDRHSLDHLTLNGFAEIIKRQFIMSKTLYKNGELLWKSVEDIDPFLLEIISNEVLETTITQGQIREISRTEPWRGYWSIDKNNIFQGSVFNLTEEQKSLILYSKMYDSAYEHPECPTEEIINNDDIFDGWMISEHRKRTKDKMTKQLGQRMGKNQSKLADSDEVFLVAKSKKDARRINSLNDAGGQIVKAQRNAVIKKKGVAVDANFPDRKIQIQQQGNQQFVNKVKGK